MVFLLSVPSCPETDLTECDTDTSYGNRCIGPGNVRGGKEPESIVIGNVLRNVDVATSNAVLYQP